MAYEVYSFQHLTRQSNLNCIAPLIQHGLDMHAKDMQMLKNKVEELKVFSSSISKAVVKYEIDEKSDVQSPAKEKNTPTFISSTEEDSKKLIHF